MQITAIVGSYRNGGIIEQAVDEILNAAAEEGAKVAKVRLSEVHLEFCTNCRSCTQTPGNTRGECPLEDDLGGLLDQIERSDVIVLGSPVNFGTVTAIMKRFIERLVCFAYWPWGARGPSIRAGKTKRRAVLVASSAAPALVARFAFPVLKPLKTAVWALGAKPEAVLYLGMSANKSAQRIGEGAVHKARRIGKRLARYR